MILNTKIINSSTGKSIILHNGDLSNIDEGAKANYKWLQIFEMIVREKIQYQFINDKEAVFEIELTRRQVNKAIWRLEHTSKHEDSSLKIFKMFLKELKPLKSTK